VSEALLCPLCKKADGVGPEFCMCPYEDLQAALRAAYLSLSDVPRWIPVSERLPDTFQRCLVHTKYCGDRPIQESWYGQVEDGTEGFWLGGVTHWMPLPEAPK
jgi:hypothetical protein